MWKIGANPVAGLHEVNRIIGVFFDARGDRKDVRVEDDVLGGQADFINEQSIGALADFLLPRCGICLAGFVEGHDDNCGAVATAKFGVFAELSLPFLQADGVND